MKRSTKIPTAAKPQLTKEQQNLAQALDALVENTESMQGRRDPLDKAINWRDLGDLGLVELRRRFIPNQLPVVLNPNVFDPLTGGYSEIPPKPSNLVALRLDTVAYLAWDVPEYSNHALAEVYRNTEDNRANAVYVGSSPDIFFVDNDIDKDTTYYYWIKFLSAGGKDGIFNKQGGTLAEYGNGEDIAVFNRVIAATITGQTIRASTLVGNSLYAGLNSDTSGFPRTYRDITGFDAEGAPIFDDVQGYFQAVIDPDGSAYFNNVYARGNIEATSMTTTALVAAVARMSQAEIDYLILYGMTFFSKRSVPITWINGYSTWDDNTNYTRTAWQDILPALDLPDIQFKAAISGNPTLQIKAAAGRQWRLSRDSDDYMATFLELEYEFQVYDQELVIDSSTGTVSYNDTLVGTYSGTAWDAEWGKTSNDSGNAWAAAHETPMSIGLASHIHATKRRMVRFTKLRIRHGCGSYLKASVGRYVDGGTTQETVCDTDQYGNPTNCRTETVELPDVWQTFPVYWSSSYFFTRTIANSPDYIEGTTNSDAHRFVLGGDYGIIHVNNGTPNIEVEIVR